jgi:hypothetical protein
MRAAGMEMTCVLAMKLKEYAPKFRLTKTCERSSGEMAS